MQPTKFPKDGKRFSIRAKKRLLDLDLTVDALARSLNRPRSTVSTAIHSDRFPRVRQQVKKELGL